MISLDKCNGSCNTLTKISGKICFPNKKEDVNLSVFNLTKRKYESKTLTENKSCFFLMVANVTQIKSETMINVNVSVKIQEKMCAKMVMFGILLHVVVKVVDKQKNIVDNSVIVCQWIIGTTKGCSS